MVLTRCRDRFVTSEVLAHKHLSGFALRWFHGTEFFDARRQPPLSFTAVCQHQHLRMPRAQPVHVKDGQNTHTITRNNSLCLGYSESEWPEGRVSMTPIAWPRTATHSVLRPLPTVAALQTTVQSVRRLHPPNTTHKLTAVQVQTHVQ